MWEERGRREERRERREEKIPHSPNNSILLCIKLYSRHSNAQGGTLPFLPELQGRSRLLVVPILLINPLSRCWKFFPGPVLHLIDAAAKVSGGDAGSMETGVDQTERADPIYRSNGDSLVTDCPPHNLSPCVYTSFTCTSTMTKINCNKFHSVLFS